MPSAISSTINRRSLSKIFVKLCMNRDFLNPWEISYVRISGMNFITLVRRVCHHVFNLLFLRMWILNQFRTLCVCPFRYSAGRFKISIKLDFWRLSTDIGLSNSLAIMLLCLCLLSDIIHKGLVSRPVLRASANVVHLVLVRLNIVLKSSTLNG